VRTKRPSKNLEKIQSRVWRGYSRYYHLIRSEEAVIFPLQSDSWPPDALACFHLSTAKEMDLFTNKIPLEDKKITAEFVFTIFGLPMMIMLLRAI
jgi:hypothetical protein